LSHATCLVAGKAESMNCYWSKLLLSAANFLAWENVGACVSDCGIGQHPDLDGNCVNDALCMGYCPKSTTPSFFYYIFTLIISTLINLM